MRLTKALQIKSKQIDIISSFFDPESVEELARRNKFVQRESPLSGMDFFLLCVFAHQKMDCLSLEDMCGELYKRGVALTKQSLQDRFNEHAVEFITALLNKALSIKLNLGRIITSGIFNRIVIFDSTQVELPETFSTKYRGHGGAASGSALKLQYGYDLLSQKMLVLSVHSAVQPDRAQGLVGLQENDLRIEDLGYFQLQRLEQIGAGKAFFLSRYRFGIVVFEWKNAAYQQIDLLELERSMQAGQRRTLNVFIGHEQKLPVRMVIEKVPAEVVAEKRRKLQYDPQIKRKSLSKKRLKLCSLNIYITNTTEEQLPCEQIRHYYSLRWQIEIIFKSWKSVYRIDQTKPMKLARFECMHLGALILITITTNIMAVCRMHLLTAHSKELSEFRFFKLMKSSLELFKQAIISSNQTLLDFLVLLEKMALRHAVKQAKAGKSTPFDILNIAA